MAALSRTAIHWAAAALLLFAATVGVAEDAATADAVLDGAFLKSTVAPGLGGALSQCIIKASGVNCAGETGLLQEGFGVGNPYIPNRRLNETMEAGRTPADIPTVVCGYDCDGPNINGLHITKSIEAIPNEASVRVRWKVENKGTQRQWVAPWVRNDIAIGGAANPLVRIDAPTLSGVAALDRTGYYPASRNWIALTDPQQGITLFGAFNCDQVHSFLAVDLKDEKRSGFQAAFVPRVMSPGDTWETSYRMNIVRGLKHVDFACQEIAAQIEYQKGTLEVLLASVKTFDHLQIHANIVAENGRRWRMPPKQFSIQPNQLIRCTFDWNAPGAGVYDFLAQLKRGDGTPVELNQELAPPHGGIDTRFAVGKSRNAPMAAWTDAPYALDRGERKLPRALAVESPTAIWIESPIEKIFRNDNVQPTGLFSATAVISLARNERESFQIVIRPPKDEDWVDTQFKVGDLTNEKTGEVMSAKNISVYKVNYYSVRIPSFFEGPTGDWPDALPPFKRFTAKGGQCSPVWFTVYAPPGTAPGKYKGRITLTSAGMRPVVFTLEATVYDFDLPATPALKTDFRYWPKKAIENGKRAGCKLQPATLAVAYAANAFEHRVTLREAAQLPAPAAGDYAGSLQRAIPALKDVLKAGATTVAVPPELLEYPDQLKAAEAFVAGNNLESKAFCPIADEPLPSAWPTIAERITRWQSIAPHIPVMAPTMGIQPFLPPDPAIWTIHSQVMDTPNNQAVLDRIKSGKEVWWYVNQRPPHPYANLLLDFAAIEHRILFWQTWALGIGGFHYWAVNYTETDQDPYADQLSVTPVNGDGFLVYPGVDGPVNSIRWETIRDGIEDYDYLALLKERLLRLKQPGKHPEIVEKAIKLLDVRAIAADLVSYTRDPAVILKRRNDIAQMIVELK